MCGPNLEARRSTSGPGDVGHFGTLFRGPNPPKANGSSGSLLSWRLDWRCSNVATGNSFKMSQLDECRTCLAKRNEGHASQCLRAYSSQGKFMGGNFRGQAALGELSRFRRGSDGNTNRLTAHRVWRSAAVLFGGGSIAIETARQASNANQPVRDRDGA